MTPPLRLLVADDDAILQKYYRVILPKLGYEVVGVAKNGAELVELASQTCPDLILTDLKMPGMDGLQAIEHICGEQPLPVVLVTAHSEPVVLDHLDHAQIFAFLHKPFMASDFVPIITLAMARYDQFQKLCSQADSLQQAMADRALLERALGILMLRWELDEQAAFAHLEQLAQDQNQKLVAIASDLIRDEDPLASA